MKKFVAAVAAMILVILPSTASASSFQLVGKCTIENGKVTLFGEVSGYTYGQGYPMEWEFLTRSVDSDGWRSEMFDGTYRQTLIVDGESWWFRFRSDSYRTEGRVYGLDLELYDGLDRVYKVAYFNDSRPRSVERCNRTFDA